MTTPVPMGKQQNLIAFSGRLLLALIFLISGLSKIPNWEQTVGYMASQGIPWPPVFLFPAIFVEVLGGLSLLLGIRTRWAAMALFLYLIPVTILFHGFWSLGGMERQLQQINFLKNLAIMGGLLMIRAFGAGAVSFDARFPGKKAVKPEARQDRVAA